MTPKEVELLSILSERIDLNDPEIFITVKKIQKGIKAIISIFEEMLYSDKDMFERIYLLNWSTKVRCEIIGRYLNVDPDRILMSPDRNEIFRFCSESMTCHELLKIYESIRIICGMTIREFAIAWRMLNETGEMKYIMFQANPDPERLSSKAREIYSKEKEGKKLNSQLRSLIQSMESDDE